MKNQYLIGTAEITLAAFILGFSGPFTRWASLPAGAMSFMRTLVPCLILGAVLLYKRRRSPAEWPSLSKRTVIWLFVASALNAARIILLFEGFRLTSIGNVITVLYTWPAFVLLLGALFLGEKLRGVDLILIGVAFAGMTIVYSGGGFNMDNSDFLGMSLMVVSSILYSLMIVLIRKQKVQGLRATFWQNLLGPFVFLPAFLGALGTVPVESWAFAAGNGFFIGTVAFFLFFTAYGKIPSAVVGHISYLEVVFAVLWGAVLFNEPVTWRLLVGGGLIILSMAFRGELVRRETLRQPS